MTWFKVDDTLALHAKVLAAGNAAMGLWVRSGAWSMQQLTDGFVPDGVAATLGSKAEARKLVEVGLWMLADGGYQFHQWTDVQRTKEQVEADRHAASERQRHARERAKSQRESRRDNGVSHGPPVSRPPDQTRPDQTSSSSGTTSSDDEEGGKRRAPKRAHQLPDDFVPNETNRRIAAERGLDLRAVFEQFADHHRAKGNTMKDWHLAFNTWLRRERPQAPTATSDGHSPNMQAHMRLIAQVAEAEASNVSPFRQLGGAS